MENRKEYRSVQFQARAEEKDEGGKKLVVRGYAILFNTEAEINDFWGGKIRETIEPTALDDTDLTNVYFLSGHDIRPTSVLGRAGINLRLDKDNTGLFFECTLPNTQEGRDIYNLIESGLVDGMSFGFTSDDDINYEEHTRVIHKINELYEISVTPFPAYKEASIIAQNERQAEENKQKEEEQQKAAEAEDRAKRAEDDAAKAKLEAEEAEKKAELEAIEELLKEEEDSNE